MKKERIFFFEKKKQKTFGLWRTWPGKRTRQRIKVFVLLFLQKKKTLSSGALS
jgi:hypothetical protein